MIWTSRIWIWPCCPEEAQCCPLSCCCSLLCVTRAVSVSSLEAQLVSGLSPLSRGRGCSDADSEGREVAPEPGSQPTAPGNWVFTTVLLQTSENTSSALQLGENSLVEEVLTEISKINLIARWWLWSDCWWDSPPHQPQASITIWQKQTDNGIK